MTPASPSPFNPRPSSFVAGTAAGQARHHAATGILSSRTTELLQLRGMDADLCEALGIETASSPDGGDDWIAIPFLKAGAVVNRKYRRVVKRPDAANFAQDKGGEQCWWNYDVLLDRATAGQPIIITEGELDAIVALQCGLGRVMSVPGGAPQAETKGDGKYGFIADTLPLMSEVREFVLAVDNDPAGIALLNDLAKRLGRGRCKFANYPAGCKDLNEVLFRHGPSGVVEAITKAKWLQVPGLYTMDELPPVPEPEPMVIGIHGLAEHFRMRLGDFSILTGMPGLGKSTFVNDLACRMAHHHGWHTCFASPEQSPQVDHRRALRTWASRKPEATQSKGELEIADQFINDQFSFVVGSDDEDFDLDWLLDKLASAVVRYDAKLCVIDPWNELDHAKPKDMTTTEYVGRAIRQLKKFAKKWQVHLMVVAHPAKISRNKDGSAPRPTLYDISDSAHWFNKSDVGLILHPGEDEDGGKYTSLLIAKSRYHDKIGKPGEVRLQFVPHTARFEAA